MKAILVTAILSAVAIGAQAEDGTLRAFVGARVIPIAGPELADGVLVVRGSTLEAVGPRSATAVPPGAEIVDLAGRVVMPGLVDTHSHIGSPAGGDQGSLRGGWSPPGRVSHRSGLALGDA